MYIARSVHIVMFQHDGSTTHNTDVMAPRIYPEMV